MKTMTRALSAMLPLLAALSLPLLVHCGDGDEIPGPAAPYCQKTCTKADDCCKTPPCDKAPESQGCISGLCKYVGCSVDADCPDFTSGLLKMKCEKVKYDGYTLGACIPACSADTDCPKIPFVNIQMSCKSITVYGHTAKTCVYPCKADPDCGAFKAKCKDGYCDMYSVAAEPECKTDADCASNTGEKKCDVASGSCTCESDQACIDGYKATGSTFNYRCTK